MKISGKTVIVTGAFRRIRRVGPLELACHDFRRLLLVVRNAKLKLTTVNQNY
ncbi:MAG: hypothetical protein ACTMUB_01240 [cyanobacterium endosymbiont of Rhopalodia musculus]|uniref:hypothetical protein n=1 Tax=cyanobacterium endosymbiont of Epithemia clementina EcSB TaxID=3034674 RepID=UPI002480DE83|nr:hypothetical protein [cyanobacterium endosymbiont of Epithemia clementina EcSB]WGT66888.1 hypothetical protein P3F56_06455 [cyanobacterium endosymbiont of Epithemia clementina EcSB]